MGIYTVLSLICLFYLVLLALYVIINTVDRKKRAAFLRDFKKGKFALLYIVCFPLFFIGAYYGACYEHGGSISISEWFRTGFTMIHKTIETVALKFDFSSIEKLMSDNKLYELAVYTCFLFSVLNALMFTLSFISRHVSNFIGKASFYLSKKKKVIVIGNNAANITICDSAENKDYSKLLIDVMPDSSCVGLHAQKITYCALSDDDAVFERIRKIVEREQNKSPRRSHECYCYVVINTMDDDRNLRLCKRFADFIEKEITQMQEKTKGTEDLADIRARFFSCVNIYVYGDPRYEAIYESVVSGCYGIIRYINKYRRIAVDLIAKHPLTEFMDEHQIDYETSLIKPETEINVLLIGFGKTNRQIFLTSVANNQFLTSGKEKEDPPVLKQVNYHIFDKEHAENNKNLNHNYYRFKNEVPGDLTLDDYLPLPEFPANEEYHILDINDNDFYNSIGNCVKIENSINYIVISFGSDLENIDLAQKLIAKRREWGVDDKLVIFVKVRAKLRDEILLNDNKCFFIGNDTEVVYNLERLIGDDFHGMAMRRNKIYALQNHALQNKKTAEELDAEEIAACEKNADLEWYMKKSQIERESNTYACLSLRSKLHLMGLELCSQTDPGDALLRDDYLDIYAKDDRPDYIGKTDLVEYTLGFKSSRRHTMAVHEHYRWNSYMISKGMIPATKDQILHEKTAEGKPTKGKDYHLLRHHGNLTTFEGLIEFRKMLAEANGREERDFDVIKYDYELLDGIYSLLNESKLKIVKKKRIV